MVTKSFAAGNDVVHMSEVVTGGYGVDVANFATTVTTVTTYFYK